MEGNVMQTGRQLFARRARLRAPLSRTFESRRTCSRNNTRWRRRGRSARSSSATAASPEFRTGNRGLEAGLHQPRAADSYLCSRGTGGRARLGGTGKPSSRIRRPSSSRRCPPRPRPPAPAPRPPEGRRPARGPRSPAARRRRRRRRGGRGQRGTRLPGSRHPGAHHSRRGHSTTPSQTQIPSPVARGRPRPRSVLCPRSWCSKYRPCCRARLHTL
mmetsp:Transcript_43370/g.139381  ORF Transcript_43370/g.139381 Transcript_43370/m.139381 type:complete len:216 (+) Transcript_43370:102-749(+)